MNKADMVKLYAQLILIRRELLHVSEDAGSMLYFLKDREKYVNKAEEIHSHIEKAFSLVKDWFSRVEESLKKESNN